MTIDMPPNTQTSPSLFENKLLGGESLAGIKP